MRKLPASQQITLDGPAGRLEALLESPRDAEVTGFVRFKLGETAEA